MDGHNFASGHSAAYQQGFHHIRAIAVPVESAPALACLPVVLPRRVEVPAKCPSLVGQTYVTH